MNVDIAMGYNEKELIWLEDIAWCAYREKLGWIYCNHEKEAREMLRSLLNSSQTIVARINGKIVGYCCVQTNMTPFNWKIVKVLIQQCNFRSLLLFELNYLPRNDELYIHMLAVHPNYRNNCIGSRLLKSAYMHSQQLQLPFVSLHVTFENTSAKRLYDREGFVEESKDELCCCLPALFNYAFTGTWYMRRTINIETAVSEES